MFNAKNEIGLLGLIGIVVNLSFGVYYTYLKYMEKELKHSLSSEKLTENKSESSVWILEQKMIVKNNWINRLKIFFYFILYIFFQMLLSIFLLKYYLCNK